MSYLEKRSISLAGHATSLALEQAFWAALEALAQHRGLSLARLIATIDAMRAGRPLASSCRLEVLDALQASVASERDLSCDG